MSSMLRSAADMRGLIYVGGDWAAPSGTGTIDVDDPSTRELVGRIPSCDDDDVDAAASAAAAALDSWAGTEPHERAAAIERLGDAVADRAEEFARTMSFEMGTPISFARSVQVGLGISDLRTAAAAAGSFEWERRIGNSTVVTAPIGVVACITPWNFPLHQVTAKVAYALAAGCTVVLKPSELSSLTAFRFFEAIDDVGFPPGVVNLVTGYGPTTGEMLATHPLVDMVSFTGSTLAGRRVARLAAGTIKKVALELGGKSANVLLPDLPDADFDRAVRAGVANCFRNAGQVCSALTRMLVHESQYERALTIAADAAAGFVLGDALDESTTLGPVVSATQRERVLDLIAQGKASGARVITDPGDISEASDPIGHLVPPTIFADVTNDMTIAREEIFGPVLVIMRYANVDEALHIANDSDYGLAGAVWSLDASNAEAFARRMQTGQVSINGGAFNPAAPFGGFKQSGVGRELGVSGLEEFTQPKALQF